MSPATLIAGSAILIGCLLVAYWYRRRMMPAKPGRGPVGAPETQEFASDVRELTERLAAELDRKAERLELLLAQADDRIQRLEMMSASQPGLDPRLVEPRQASRFSEDASHREVYELADKGLTPVEIAKRLDRPTGQVELILNLRRGSVAL